MKKIVVLLLMSSMLYAMEDLNNMEEAADLLSSDDVQEIIRGQGLIFKIKDKTDTLKIGIGSQDIVNGKITLNKTGSYALSDNLVTDIEITGTNVLVDLDGRSVFGTIRTSSSGTVIKNGAVVPLPPRTTQQAATAAITLESSAKGCLIKHVHIDCTDSSLTDTTIELTALAGRNGIEVKGSIINVFDVSILPGAAADTEEANALNGGTAIVLSGSANKVRVMDCIVVSGNGGTAANDNGGNGGHGIHAKDTVSHVEIARCTIFGTGKGGDGAGTGGNGGHGVVIESTAVDIEVHDCRIRNTGAAGTPGGAGGKAILDAVTTAGAVSIIFSNFANNVENAIKFDLAGTGLEQGVVSPNPPTATVINPYANVYVA